MRSLACSIAVALAGLAGCSTGGLPAIQGPGAPPPFDALNASMQLAVGMPEEIAIATVGWLPVSSEVQSCGVLAGYAWTCEKLTFGAIWRNRLIVYVDRSSGQALVNNWVVEKR